MKYITQSSVFSLTFELFKTDGITPLFLGDKIVKFIIKKNLQDLDPILEEIVYEYPETHKLNFSYDANLTASIPEGLYYAGLKLFTKDGNHQEIWNDKIIVKKGVFYD